MVPLLSKSSFSIEPQKKIKNEKGFPDEESSILRARFGSIINILHL